MNQESLYFYFKVKEETKDRKIIIGEGLTDYELKSIDESDKLESGEDL